MVRIITFLIAAPDDPVYLSALTIFKNEAPYLEEWLEYHILVGVERFWLINNDSVDNYTIPLARYLSAGIVRLSHFPGVAIQLKAYATLLRTLRELSFWVAVIDLDEFILPTAAHCLPSVLREHERRKGVEAHWMLYSSNGRLKWEPGLVIERFPNHCARNVRRNTWVKSIVNPRRIRRFHIHHQTYLTGGEGKCLPYDVLRVNHYWVKSFEEWEAKVGRGLATARKRYNISLFWTCEDVVKDDRVMDWCIPLVKQNLRARFTHFPCHVAKQMDYYVTKRKARHGKIQNAEFAWLEELRLGIGHSLSNWNRYAPGRLVI